MQFVENGFQIVDLFLLKRLVAMGYVLDAVDHLLLGLVDLLGLLFLGWSLRFFNWSLHFFNWSLYALGWSLYNFGWSLRFCGYCGFYFRSSCFLDNFFFYLLFEDVVLRVHHLTISY